MTIEEQMTAEMVWDFETLGLKEFCIRYENEIILMGGAAALAFIGWSAIWFHLIG